MKNAKVISFPMQYEAFYFLGIENTIAENSNFGAFWKNFFDKGGYEKIDPYQKDPNCVNVWFRKTPDEKVYMQGKIVSETAEVPEGYTLIKFPAGEYLVVTTEWLPSYAETMQHINHDYHKNAGIPAGYARHNESENGIFLIERWGAETKEGYRYEFWVPMQKCQ